MTGHFFGVAQLREDSVGVIPRGGPKTPKPPRAGAGGWVGTLALPLPVYDSTNGQHHRVSLGAARSRRIRGRSRLGCLRLSYHRNTIATHTYSTGLPLSLVNPYRSLRYV